ncbi:MAG TPA: flagellar basal-body MS-ring/collar protein FliF [Hyphomicrobiales bacterium]|nr:flagellar basal-body MS-ring/collar protein FliF [Hyphomicrobiales bacterium]
MAGILEFLRRLGPARLAAMGAVTLALVGFFAVVLMRATAPDLVTLYSGLAPTDAAAITKALDAQGIAYETNAEGTAIRVAKDAVASARMHLAESGLPSGGSVGWEIFDKSNGLSATSFLQNVNRLRAIEGELARSIETINRVTAARVHLVMPERTLFQRDAAKPSAAIVLKVAGTLGAGQIRAIRHLVASAVEGLEPGRISVVDETGHLLADGAGGDDALTGVLGDQERAYEQNLTQKVQAILDRVVGPGRGRAELHAEFDHSHITQTSDRYDPDSRVVRSTQTREENGQTKSTDAGVSVGNQLPNSQSGDKSNGGQSETRANTEETTNYEISRTTTTEVKQGPRLSRVSVAVLVDGVYASAKDGATTYQPRSPQELDKIAALVKSTIGFDKARGDQVEVVNLRFAEPPGRPLPLDEGGNALFGFSKSDVMQLVQTGILALISLLVLMVVVRPLVRRILAPDTSAAILPPGQETALLPAPDGTVPAESGPPLSPSQRMIEMAQVDGLVQAQTLKAVGEIAQANPKEAVGVIRQWLNEPA